MNEQQKTKFIKEHCEKLYNLMDKFDPTGYNSSLYKKTLGKMSQKELVSLAKNMLKQDDFIFSIELDTFSKEKGKELTLERIEEISNEVGIPLREYVILPFRNPNGPPMVTKTPVPICYLMIKRFFQQILDHKNAISNDNSKINPITGQVIDEDKTASCSDVETYTLAATNQMNTIKELLGPRSDDEVSKQQMMSQIEATGQFRLDDLDIKTHNKQSINTVETFFKAACIDLKFSSND